MSLYCRQRRPFPRAIIRAVPKDLHCYLSLKHKSLQALCNFSYDGPQDYEVERQAQRGDCVGLKSCGPLATCSWLLTRAQCSSVEAMITKILTSHQLQSCK